MADDLMKRLQVHMTMIIEEEMDRAIYNDVKNRAIEIAKEHVREEVYNSYTPIYDNRTGSLEDSISASVRKHGKTRTLSVGHDESKLQHKSFDGSDAKELPYWIQEGRIHPLSDVDYSYIAPRPYFENAIEQIESEAIGIIIKNIKG